MSVKDLIIGVLAGLGGGSGIWQLILNRRIREKKKEILRGMLTDDRWEWRKFETLQRVIRESSEKTRDLLIEIGARASTAEADVWTLEK